jgi:hypothetical protein
MLMLKAKVGFQKGEPTNDALLNHFCYASVFFFVRACCYARLFHYRQALSNPALQRIDA